MKPIKSAHSLAKWLLRIASAMLVYSQYFKTFQRFSFNNLDYFIAFVMVIVTIFFVVGGFLKNSSITVVSSLILFILSLILIIISGFQFSVIIENIGILSISLFFVARGNKS